MNKKITVLYTGGTLGMIPSEQGLVPADDLQAQLNKALQNSPESRQALAGISYSFIELSPLLDSANMQPKDWETIADTCLAQANVGGGTTGLVIVHGTDTLAYSAAALAFLLGAAKKNDKLPVVITGALKPLASENSDALGNLVGAIIAATETKNGVWVYFNQRQMPAARVVKKDATSFDCFDAPRWNGRAADHDYPQNPLPLSLSWQSKPRALQAIHVDCARIMPGFRAKNLSALLSAQPHALILSLYGTGTLPSANFALFDAIKAATEQGIIVVAVSQCYISYLDFSIYAAGAGLIKAGALSGADITLEAAYAKLWVLLRLGYSVAEIKNLFTLSLADEMTND